MSIKIIVITLMAFKMRIFVYVRISKESIPKALSKYLELE